jgi:F0F1-type ATP synthase epsilon subunit
MTRVELEHYVLAQTAAKVRTIDEEELRTAAERMQPADAEPKDDRAADAPAPVEAPARRGRPPAN